MAQNPIKKIAIFCGAFSGKHPSYCKIAEDLAELFCKDNIGLVYGAAKVGVMGALADRMLRHGGEVIGIIPHSLVALEVTHPRLSKLHRVDSMHQRKWLMSELADAFILLPGGIGSLDEFFEIYTWAKLSHHSKPCGILNVNGYYDKLLEFLDHMVEQGFLDQIHRNMILIHESPALLLQALKNYHPPATQYRDMINLEFSNPLP